VTEELHLSEDDLCLLHHLSSEGFLEALADLGFSPRKAESIIVLNQKSPPFLVEAKTVDLCHR
jgi:hypothetical protein